MLSGNDTNPNRDAAPDRTIRNPAGVRNTASTVTALTNSAGQVVDYLADFFNAFNHPQYIPGSRNDEALLDAVGVG